MKAKLLAAITQTSCVLASWVVLRSAVSVTCAVALARTLLAGVVVAGMVAVGTPANAVPVEWFLLNVTFDDGATATGHFVFDASTNTYSDWFIRALGSLTAPGFEYSVVNSISGSHSASSLYLEFPLNFVPPPDTDLVLFFAGALTDAGGEVALLGGVERENERVHVRAVTGGSVATPLPA